MYRNSLNIFFRFCITEDCALFFSVPFLPNTFIIFFFFNTKPLSKSTHSRFWECLLFRQNYTKRVRKSNMCSYKLYFVGCFNTSLLMKKVIFNFLSAFTAFWIIYYIHSVCRCTMHTYIWILYQNSIHCHSRAFRHLNRHWIAHIHIRIKQTKIVFRWQETFALFHKKFSLDICV